jgi:hypothetical protein
MSDITDAGARLRAMNDALEDPMAWLAFATDGSESCAVYMTDGEAKAAAEAMGWQIMPLYLAPRLTDEEREAIELVAEAYSDKVADAYAHNEDDQHYSQIAATLRGLLARMSGNGDCLAPDNATIRDNSDRSQPIAKCDATPPAHATPAECSVPPDWTSRPYWVDPPSGHRYGFPRLYDPAKDGDMRQWMIANGYPERLANQGLACTFTACTEDVGK